MLKSQKLEYQQQVEKYMEEHQIYDIFEELMKGLLKEKPADPLQFMVSKLENPERMGIAHWVAKRIFVMGPPGCRKTEKALTFANELNYVTVSVGDLLEGEMSKKSEYGKHIAEAKARFVYGMQLTHLQPTIRS